MRTTKAHHIKISSSSLHRRTQVQWRCIAYSKAVEQRLFLVLSFLVAITLKFLSLSPFHSSILKNRLDAIRYVLIWI